MSWPITELGSLVEIRGGGTPSKAVPEYWNGNIPWASVKDLKTTELKETEDYITADAIKKSASNLIPAGNIIVPTRMALGKVAINTVDMAINQDLKALIPIDQKKLDKGYLMRFLESQASFLEKQGKGATVKGITLDVLRSLAVPLPPLEEQKRIAAILDKAEVIRRKRQQAIKLADDFLSSVFLEMFGDPVTNPKGWEVKPVGEVADCIVPGRDKPKSFTGSTPWVTTNDLNHLDFTHCSKSSIGLSEKEIKNVRARVVPKNSVLMTCVGDIGVISISASDMVINQQLHAFLPSEEYVSTYLAYALSFQKGYMMSMASSTTLPYMNKTICNSVPVAVPPLQLQLQFENIFLHVAELKNKLVNQDMSPLFNSLSKKAFSGKL